jgi:SAM-dependent methyltransferase
MARFRADFGLTADDYGRHRAGFPEALFTRLAAFGVGAPGQSLLDLGTGTGTLARGFARRGAVVTAIDPSPEMLEQARILAAEEGADVVLREARAEATGLPDAAVDAVTAGQCWHWFDGPAALAEIRRVLRPDGRLAICHFDWLPIGDNVVAATEALILAHNPDWPGAGGHGFYPPWASAVAAAGFGAIETFSFDVDQVYSHAGWRGRVRASAGIGGSLGDDAVAAFDAEHGALLTARYPDDPLSVPHRCWALVCRPPAAT